MTLFGKSRHYALAVLTVVYVFNFVDRQLLAILLEPIKNEFDVSDTAMGFLYGFAFSLFYATVAIPVARIADRSSRRNILAIAVSLWSFMTVLCGLAANYWQLLLLRMGVAVGEAGGTPPSQSMVTDLYPPKQRARAMAVFASATFIGTLLALVGGAYIAQSYGWRWAFVIVGIPGILLGLVVWRTVPEPTRGAWDAPHSRQPGSPEQGLAAAFLLMWRIRELRYIMSGCALASMSGFALGFWAPAFMIRVHAVSMVEAGLIIGGMGATIGLFGSLFGGWLCDHLAKQNRNWLLRIPAISLLLSLPTILLFLGFPEAHVISLGAYQLPVAALFFALTSFVGGWWAAPTYVAIQELVAPEYRTLACAALLFLINLIGFGLGPLLVGVLADLLDPLFGGEAVRYALMLTTTPYLLAILLYYFASKTFVQRSYGV